MFAHPRHLIAQRVLIECPEALEIVPQELQHVRVTPHLEAGKPTGRIGGPGIFAEFAVADDIDLVLGLFAHDVLHLFVQGLFIGFGVDLLPLGDRIRIRPNRFRPDQAPNVTGKNSVATALHCIIPLGKRSSGGGYARVRRRAGPSSSYCRF